MSETEAPALPLVRVWVIDPDGTFTEIPAKSGTINVAPLLRDAGVNLSHGDTGRESPSEDVT